MTPKSRTLSDVLRLIIGKSDAILSSQYIILLSNVESSLNLYALAENQSLFLYWSVAIKLYLEECSGNYVVRELKSENNVIVYFLAEMNLNM